MLAKSHDHGRSQPMYNLIVGFTGGQASADRVVEYTDNAILQYIAPSGAVDPARLPNLPTLLMPEVQDSGSRQVARVGHVEDLTLTGGLHRFRFVPTPGIPEVDTSRIEELAQALQIDGWEFNRTHWAVKDVDLMPLSTSRYLGLHSGRRSSACRLNSEQRLTSSR
jgi:hypothetical protein